MVTITQNDSADKEEVNDGEKHEVDLKTAAGVVEEHSKNVKTAFTNVQNHIAETVMDTSERGMGALEALKDNFSVKHDKAKKEVAEAQESISEAVQAEKQNVQVMASDIQKEIAGDKEDAFKTMEVLSEKKDDIMEMVATDINDNVSEASQAKKESIDVIATDIQKDFTDNKEGTIKAVEVLKDSLSERTDEIVERVADIHENASEASQAKKESIDVIATDIQKDFTDNKEGTIEAVEVLKDSLSDEIVERAADIQEKLPKAAQMKAKDLSAILTDGFNNIAANAENNKEQVVESVQVLRDNVGDKKDSDIAVNAANLIKDNVQGKTDDTKVILTDAQNNNIIDCVDQQKDNAKAEQDMALEKTAELFDTTLGKKEDIQSIIEDVEKSVVDKKEDTQEAFEALNEKLNESKQETEEKLAEVLDAVEKAVNKDDIKGVMANVQTIVADETVKDGKVLKENISVTVQEMEENISDKNTALGDGLTDLKQLVADQQLEVKEKTLGQMVAGDLNTTATKPLEENDDGFKAALKSIKQEAEKATEGVVLSVKELSKESGEESKEVLMDKSDVETLVQESAAGVLNSLSTGFAETDRAEVQEGEGKVLDSLELEPDTTLVSPAQTEKDSKSDRVQENNNNHTNSLSELADLGRKVGGGSVFGGAVKKGSSSMKEEAFASDGDTAEEEEEEEAAAAELPVVTGKLEMVRTEEGHKVVHASSSHPPSQQDQQQHREQAGDGPAHGVKVIDAEAALSNIVVGSLTLSDDILVDSQAASSPKEVVATNAHNVYEAESNLGNKSPSAIIAEPTASNEGESHSHNPETLVIVLDDKKPSSPGSSPGMMMMMVPNQNQEDTGNGGGCSNQITTSGNSTTIAITTASSTIPVSQESSLVDSLPPLASSIVSGSKPEPDVLIVSASESHTTRFVSKVSITEESPAPVASAAPSATNNQDQPTGASTGGADDKRETGKDNKVEERDQAPKTPPRSNRKTVPEVPERKNSASNGKSNGSTANPKAQEAKPAPVIKQPSAAAVAAAPEPAARLNKQSSTVGQPGSKPEGPTTSILQYLFGPCCACMAKK